MNKRMTADAAVATIQDGMTVGIGGWGSRRKPMALIRALLRHGARDLTVVSYGGPDVGLLCAAGRVSKLIYGFVSLDSIPLEPHFRAARQAGAVTAVEYDEGMLYWSLFAAATRLPFLPTRAGLGSDVLRVNPQLRTVRSPYDDGEELVAVPPVDIDVALVHVNRADAAGNGQLLGPDPYFDELFCQAARQTFMSCERVLPTERLAEDGPPQTMRISRAYVTGVVEAPYGAHFTSCAPDYGRDEELQREYAAAAADPALWRDFASRWVDVDDSAYRAAVEARLTQQVFA